MKKGTHKSGPVSAQTVKKRAARAALPWIRCRCGAEWRGRYAINNPIIDQHRARSMCLVIEEPVSVDAVRLSVEAPVVSTRDTSSSSFVSDEAEAPSPAQDQETPQ